MNDTINADMKGFNGVKMKDLAERTLAVWEKVKLSTAADEGSSPSAVKEQEPQSSLISPQSKTRLSTRNNLQRHSSRALSNKRISSRSLVNK
jgi:hypothetical protein